MGNSIRQTVIQGVGRPGGLRANISALWATGPRDGRRQLQRDSEPLAI